MQNTHRREYSSNGKGYKGGIIEIHVNSLKLHSDWLAVNAVRAIASLTSIYVTECNKLSYSYILRSLQM